MLAVRFVVLAALVVWLGGLAVLTFLVEPTVGPIVQATLLQQFHPVAYACGAIMLVGLFVLKFVGPPPAAFVPRLGLVAAMLASAVYTGVPVAREIASVEAGMAGTGHGAAASDARRQRLDTLHRRASTLASVNIGLGLLSLFWYARE